MRRATPKSVPAWTQIDVGEVAGMTLPQAAHAARVDPKALRNWADRGQIVLFGTKPGERAWRRCAPVDVVRIAVIRRLVSYGFTVNEAASIVAETVDECLKHAAASLSAVPWPIIAVQLRGLVLIVSRDGDKLAVSFGSRQEAHGFARLTIDVSDIAQDARERCPTR